MLTGRAALVSVYLCFSCLNTLTHQSTDQVRIRDLLHMVQFIQGIVPQELDCRLYTPTISDYQKCPRTTMQCFAEEVKVLLEEWNLIRKDGDLELVTELEDLALKLKETNSECPQCELFQEKSAKMFLEDLIRTLNYIYNGPGVR